MTLRIVTHDGVFHTDDVCAIAVLHLATDGRIVVQRSRDARVINAANIAVDVGGGYYDHHQLAGNGARPNGTPYASLGLVWRDYGHDAIARVVGDGLEPGVYRAIWDRVDQTFCEPIDAADNGVNLVRLISDVQPVTIQDLVDWFRPLDGSNQEYDEAFHRTVACVLPFVRAAITAAYAYVQAEHALIAAIRAWADRGARADDPVVIERFVPDWKRPVVTATTALYVVYPSAGSWRVQGVPDRVGSNDLRRPLPEAWAALNAEELASLTGVSDATFCHRARFIAGAETLDGALALARLATAS